MLYETAANGTDELKTRAMAVDRLVNRGMGDFVRRHALELYPEPHTIGQCALPGYPNHNSSSPETGRMGCVPTTQFLERCEQMGDSNPLLFYRELEQEIQEKAPHVRVALIPAWNHIIYTGDIMIIVEPYGPRAEDLRRAIRTGSWINFPQGRCVGYYRAAAGYSGGRTVLHIDTIQTDGNRSIKTIDGKTGLGAEEHSLPAGLRKIYMDGKKPTVSAWFDEGLAAVESACGRMDMLVTIASWESAVSMSADPEKMSRSVSARNLYTNVPPKRGYEKRRMEIEFPAHSSPRSRKRSGDIWVKV